MCVGYILLSILQGLVSSNFCWCNMHASIVLALFWKYVHTWVDEKVLKLIQYRKMGSSTSHTDTSMTYCQSITQTLRIIWVKCIPLSLRSKTRRRATPLLPTWIYSCRSRVTVSCALPFTTNMTISTSIAQTFRSWVAIFHLRPPMVFLSHSSYGMPGLAPLINVFNSKGGATFI